MGSKRQTELSEWSTERELIRSKCASGSSCELREDVRADARRGLSKVEWESLEGGSLFSQGGYKSMKSFTIEMENGGIMKGELYEDIAPKTVANWTKLANEGFYDGLIFHRVIPGFMIQGGCPNGNGMGGPGYTIEGEFTMNGFKNDLKHERGVLSMARAMDPNSAGSQFFIMTSTSPHLDGQYASFGRVTEGMEVADAIVSVKRNMMDKPLVDQVIKTIRVED